MAISLNNVQTASATSSLSYTPSSVSDSCLVVVFGDEDVSNNQPVTSVQFGATTMSVAVEQFPSGTNSNNSGIYYLVNPGTTSQTITVNGGEGARTGIIAFTLGGVDQTTPLDVTDGSQVTSSSSPHSVTTNNTTTAANTFVVTGCSFSVGSDALGLTGGATLDTDLKVASTVDVGFGYEVLTSAQSYSYSWTHPATFGGQRFTATSAAFIEAAAGGTDNLLADDLESDGEISTPSLGQIHALVSSDLESLSELSTPVLGQIHNFTADDLDSASEISTPSMTQVHAILGDGLESKSQISIPSSQTTWVTLPPPSTTWTDQPDDVTTWTAQADDSSPWTIQ